MSSLLEKPTPVLEYGVFLDTELADFIHGQSEDNEGNKYHHELVQRLKFYDGQVVPHYSHKDTQYVWFIAFDDNKIVGMLKYKTGGVESSEQPNYCNWMHFVVVDKEYEGLGIATQLINLLFLYANLSKLSILQSAYTQVGWDRIRKVFKRVAERYPGVDFRDVHTEPKFL
jgi:GNAT superfamily N-acetyltransferase